jgi:uncharacterized protein
MQPRLSAWAPLLDTRNINHGLLLPILLHCVDDQGRPAARTCKEGPRDQKISAQRPPAPVLDADPLRPHWLITTYVDVHAGYDCGCERVLQKQDYSAIMLLHAGTRLMVM